MTFVCSICGPTCICPTLNRTLAVLGYTVRTVTQRNGRRTKTILRDGQPIRFPEGTLPEKHRYVRNLCNTTAGVVWSWLRATEQV